VTLKLQHGTSSAQVLVLILERLVLLTVLNYTPPELLILPALDLKDNSPVLVQHLVLGFLIKSMQLRQHSPRNQRVN